MELLEELPLSVLFGAHGERVVALLEQIQALSRTQAECRRRTWIRTPATPTAGPGCAGPRRKGSSGPRRRTTGGTLAAPGARGKDKSPIHSGFLLVHDQLRRRALALDGDQAIVIETDEDGETEEMLAPLWQDVSDALLYAAMAQGAPQYVDAGTRRRSCAPAGLLRATQAPARRSRVASVHTPGSGSPAASSSGSMFRCTRGSNRCSSAGNRAADNWARPRRAISRTRAPAPAAHDARWRRRATAMRRWRPARAGPACPPACAIRARPGRAARSGCGGVFSQGPAFQLVRFRAPGQGLAGVAAPQGDGGELAQAGDAGRAGRRPRAIALRRHPAQARAGHRPGHASCSRPALRPGGHSGAATASPIRTARARGRDDPVDSLAAASWRRPHRRPAWRHAGHARPFIGRQRAGAACAAGRDAPRRPRGVRLAPRAARGGLAPRIIERACQRQALVLQPFLRRAGLGATPGQGREVAGKECVDAMPCAPGMPGVGRRCPFVQGPWHLQRRPVRQRGMGIVMAGRTAQGLMQPDLRLGRSRGLASEPSSASRTRARVVPWPRRRRTSWMRIRAGHAPADRSPSGHPTRTPRRRPARIPRRLGTRIRARNPGWLPEAWHVPVHEEPQRRVGQALATRQLPRRFLPLLPREIHPAGIASVPAGDVRIHAPGWRGRRRPTAAPAAAARATARCACRPRAADAAGCWHCIRCSGRPRRAARPPGRAPVRSRGTAPRVRGREEQAVFRAGWA